MEQQTKGNGGIEESPIYSMKDIKPNRKWVNRGN